MVPLEGGWTYVWAFDSKPRAHDDIMMTSCAPVWLQTILARPGDKAHYTVRGSHLYVPCRSVCDRDQN